MEHNYWQSEQRDKINAALLDFHKKGISLEKDRTVPAGSGKTRGYITLDNILRTVRKELAAHDLFIEQHLSGDLVLTRINHISGQYIMTGVPFQEMQGNNTSKIQNAGGGLTYLKRYALTAILGLTADEDNDGADSTLEVKKPGAKTNGKAVTKKELHDIDAAVKSVEAGKYTLQQIEAIYELTTDQFILLQDAAKSRKTATA